MLMREMHVMLGHFRARVPHQFGQRFNVYGIDDRPRAESVTNAIEFCVGWDTGQFSQAGDTLTERIFIPGSPARCQEDELPLIPALNRPQQADDDRDEGDHAGLLRAFTRLVVLQDDDLVLPIDMFPAELGRFDWAAAGIPQEEKKLPEASAGSRTLPLLIRWSVMDGCFAFLAKAGRLEQLPEFLRRDGSAGMTLGVPLSFEGVLLDHPFISRPVEGALHNRDRAGLRPIALPVRMLLQPRGHVLLLALGDEPPAVHIRKGLEVVFVALQRTRRETNAFDLEVGLDNGRNGLAVSMRMRILRRFESKFQKAGIRLFLGVPAVCQFGLLAIEPDHPPIFFPVEPGLRNTCHEFLP